MKTTFLLCVLVALFCIMGAFAGGLRGNDANARSLDEADPITDDMTMDDLDAIMAEYGLDDGAEADADADDAARRLMTHAEKVEAKKAAIAAKIARVAAHRAAAAEKQKQKLAAVAARNAARAAAAAKKKAAAAEAAARKKAAAEAKNKARAEAVARKKAAVEAKMRAKAEAAARNRAAAEAKAAARKKAAAAAAEKHAHKHAPPAPPAPTPAAWIEADRARLDAMPEACRAVATRHAEAPAGETAPLAWMRLPGGGRNAYNTFPNRLARRCCDVSATEATTLSWPAFIAAQGPCAAHAPVTIPCGTKVLVDGADLIDAGADADADAAAAVIDIKGLYVEGELEFVDSGVDVELRTEFIFNCGALTAGDKDANYERTNLDIVITGFTEVEYKGSKFGRAGFVTYGGETSLASASCGKDTWTRLAARAPAGATELTLQLDDLELDTAWRAGDRLMVVSTGGAGSAGPQTEVVTVVEVGGEDGRSVTIAEPLKYGHDGCEEDGPDGVVPGISCTVAGEVAPLTRNIHVRGEAACKDTQLCGHTLFAHTNHGTVCGVEFSNLGQRTTKGRYPLHLHMAGDAPELVVRGNSIHHTHNRGMVIHAMRRVHFYDNTIYDTLGHNFLFEDGMEERNTIEHNLGVLAKGVRWGCKSSHDMSFQCGSRSDDAANAFWINNMNNEFRDNVGVTMGMAFRFEMRHVMGDTRLFFKPEAMKVGHNGKIKHSVRMGKFAGNVAHSSGIGFFSYPMQNPTNQRTAGYENTVVYRCTKGIHVKNTAHRGAMNIVGFTGIHNVNHVTAHIPASKISVRRSHLINCEGCARTLPLNMRKSKFIASTEGSIFLDRYSLDYARCHGGFTNPRAKYPRGLLNFLDTSGCDADSVPPMRFERMDEVF